jgi:CheY-like chemotaxis protein
MRDEPRPRLTWSWTGNAHRSLGHSGVTVVGRFEMKKAPVPGAAVGLAVALSSGMRVAKPVLKRREQVLVVDADFHSCELIGAVLHEAGYSVDLAHDGYEALQMATRRRPDVVVSEVQMPHLDGIEMTRRMHRDDPELPVVLTSGAPNTKDLVTAAECYGAAACLQKPMDLDDLLWAIESSLAVSRQRGRRPGPPLLRTPSRRA